jgi:ATP-dependent Lon protease
MKKIPLFPLELALLPGEEVPLHVFESRYRKMLGRCIQESIPFAVVRARKEDLAQVGCETRILRVLRSYPDGRSDILVQGVERVRIGPSTEHEDGYLVAEVEAMTDGAEESNHALEDRVEEQYRRYAAIAGDIATDPPPRGPRWSFRLAEKVRLSIDARQEILEMTSENARMEKLLTHLKNLIPWLEKREQGATLIRGNGKLHPDLQGEKP